MTDETGRGEPDSPIDLVSEVDFALGASWVSPSKREVARAGLHEMLEPRIMQVLVALYQAGGRVVSRDELIARCWEGRIVGEDAINRAIGRLRRLSEADGGLSFVIETIPKIGFRLVAGQPLAATEKVPGPDAGLSSTVDEPGDPLAVAPQISSAGSGSPPEAMLATARRRWSTPVSLTAVCVIAIAAAGLWLVRDRLPWAPKLASAPVEAAARPAGISIAVLPFLNLSGNPADEYFSDGMTEEITLALAGVKGLKVVARSSAFAFKGRNEDVRSVGRALSATDVIEGSVRKQGSRLRISAELVRTDTGEHLWTRSFDRELKDVFAVQEDIATAIAGALQVPLGLGRDQNLVSSRTGDLDAYQDFLHARALYRARKATDAISTLKRVVARDPDYAPAWALFAYALSLPGNYADVGKELLAGDTNKARLLVQSKMDSAQEAARNAIRLDPRLAMGYAALAPVDRSRGNWIGCEDDFRQALALDPNDPDILYDYASFLADVGRLQDARRVQIQILAQEPFVPQYNRQAADVLWAMGQNEAALKMLEPIDSDQPDKIPLAKFYATAGWYGKAAATLRAMQASDQYSRESLDEAARLIQSAPAHAPNSIPSFGGRLNFVDLFVGAEDRYLETAERRLQVGLDGGLFRDPWAPPSASLRKKEGFKSFVRRAGFVDYWRARAWPDLCHPVGADDFACN